MELQGGIWSFTQFLFVDTGCQVTINSLLGWGEVGPLGRRPWVVGIVGMGILQYDSHELIHRSFSLFGITDGS